MTPYHFKKSILLKGVKGELVPQIASEGTGRDVLEESSKIKERIFKKEKLKSPKGIKPIEKKTEFYFSIPDSWEWERFGNLVINYDSKRKPVAKELRKTENGTYDYYGATGAIDKVDEYIFDGEYLMIGEDGGNFFVDRDNSFVANGQFWANNHVHVVKPALCDIFFLKYFLDCLNLPGLGLINGIAVPKLNQENLNSILVPVPPLEEQHRIVAKIEELLPYVDRYAEAYEKLEQFNAKFPEDMKKSILQYAIQGKLVKQRAEEGTAEELYQQIQKEKRKLIKEGKIKKDKPLPEITEDEIPFEIPSSWKWCRFGEITYFSMGKTPPRAEMEWWCKDIPWVSISDMKDYGHIKETKEGVSQKAFDEIFGNISKAGTLLMSFKLTVGRTSILDIDALHNEAIISIVPYVDRKYYYRDYLFYVLSIITQWGKSKNVIKGKTLNSKSIANLMIPLAPLNELHRIVARIEELLPYCEKIKSCSNV